MAKTGFQSVDEYLAAQPQEARAALARVRRAIRKALPEAEESISYRIPAYTIAGNRVIYFAGWKRHYSLYPISARLAAQFGDELAPYELEKSTLRFSLEQPVPAGLIARIARFRAQEAADRRKNKAAAGRGANPI